MVAYLDNNSTTKPLPAVVEGMQAYLQENYANPSSPHVFGQRSRRAIENARDSVARLLGAASPSEVIFTSCATESIGHAFHIVWETIGASGLQIVTSSVEHPAVLEAAEFYRSRGAVWSVIRVDSKGQLDLDQLESAVSKSPAFVSLMLANNETGVIFPIQEVSAICNRYKAVLHVDAVQAVGKLAVNFRDWNCDYLSMSAHKFHGPKGVGALLIRHGSPRIALIKGHQESGIRGGTENVPGIVGTGIAAEAAISDFSEGIRRMPELRDLLEKNVLSLVQGSQVNGDVGHRVCNTSNIYFPNRNSSDLVEGLSAKGVYVSAASACATGGKPSHVLRAMQLGEERANSSLRFSVGKLTTDEELQFALATLPKVLFSGLDVFSEG